MCFVQCVTVYAYIVYAYAYKIIECQKSTNNCGIIEMSSRLLFDHHDFLVASFENCPSLDQTPTTTAPRHFKCLQCTASYMPKIKMLKTKRKPELRRSTMTRVRADVRAAASRQNGLWTAIYPHCKRIWLKWVCLIVSFRFITCIHTHSLGPCRAHLSISPSQATECDGVGGRKGAWCESMYEHMALSAQ